MAEPASGDLLGGFGDAPATPEVAPAAPPGGDLLGGFDEPEGVVGPPMERGGDLLGRADDPSGGPPAADLLDWGGFGGGTKRVEHKEPAVAVEARGMGDAPGGQPEVDMLLVEAPPAGAAATMEAASGDEVAPA